MFDPKFHFGLLLVCLVVAFMVSCMRVEHDKVEVTTIVLTILLYLIGFGIRIMCAGL